MAAAFFLGFVVLFFTCEYLAGMTNSSLCESEIEYMPVGTGVVLLSCEYKIIAAAPDLNPRC